LNPDLAIINLDDLELNFEPIHKAANRKLLIAYSGGLDSHVLLHLLAHSPDYKVRAIHIHHGLQTIADSWVKHCQSVCDELGIALEIVHLNLAPKKGESIEAVAREGRYQALKKSLQKDETLVTAQHQNDQSETLLLQLFRGAGVQGLAAMPALCNFGKGKHARPLLNTTREALEAYAKKHQLNSIEDPSNQDLSFDRNYLRKQILPKLRQRWRGLDKALSRSASIQAETKQLLDEIAAQDLTLIRNSTSNTLNIQALQRLSFKRQKLLLRFWIAQSGFRYPSEKKLQHIFSDVINARNDANPLIEWQGTQIRRYKNLLYIMPPLSEHDPKQTFSWDGKRPLTIPSLNLTLQPDDIGIKNQAVSVRFRQGGETIYHPQKKQSTSLKKLFSAIAIPPWQRSRIPLVYIENKLSQILLDCPKETITHPPPFLHFLKNAKKGGDG